MVVSVLVASQLACVAAAMLGAADGPPGNTAREKKNTCVSTLLPAGLDCFIFLFFYF
jgi:hypothetical protein